MPTFSHTVAVHAPFARLWSLVRDVTRLAALFPYTRVEEISSPAPDCWLFWRQLTIPSVADLRWREQSRVVADGEMAFQAIEGDLSRYAGSWRVEPDGGKTLLSLQLDYAVPDHLAPRMPAMMVDYVMSEFFKSICTRVKEAAEASEA